MQRDMARIGKPDDWPRRRKETKAENARRVAALRNGNRVLRDPTATLREIDDARRRVAAVRWVNDKTDPRECPFCRGLLVRLADARNRLLIGLPRATQPKATQPHPSMGGRPPKGAA
jgi:hypothetical protein